MAFGGNYTVQLCVVKVCTIARRTTHRSLGGPDLAGINLNLNAILVPLSIALADQQFAVRSRGLL